MVCNERLRRLREVPGPDPGWRAVSLREHRRGPGLEATHVPVIGATRCLAWPLAVIRTPPERALPGAGYGVGEDGHRLARGDLRQILGSVGGEALNYKGHRGQAGSMSEADPGDTGQAAGARPPESLSLLGSHPWRPLGNVGARAGPGHTRWLGAGPCASTSHVDSFPARRDPQGRRPVAAPKSSGTHEKPGIQVRSSFLNLNVGHLC